MTVTKTPNKKTVKKNSPIKYSASLLKKKTSYRRQCKDSDKTPPIKRQCMYTRFGLQRLQQLSHAKHDQIARVLKPQFSGYRAILNSGVYCIAIGVFWKHYNIQGGIFSRHLLLNSNRNQIVFTIFRLTKSSLISKFD